MIGFGTKKKQAKHTADVAAKWWGDRLEQGDRDKFESKLRELVEADLLKWGRCDLSCDYDPFDHLLEAVRAAGLECCGWGFSARGILPCKHCTNITLTEINPKEGYGNRTPIISTDLKTQ